MSSDVSFILYSMEEGEGKGGDNWYAPNVQEFIY